jgi:hypothetical protein
MIYEPKDVRIQILRSHKYTNTQSRPVFALSEIKISFSTMMYAAYSMQNHKCLQIMYKYETPLPLRH